MNMLKEVVRFIKECLDHENILIYQMGKVGSTSLEDSISNATHFHTLYQRRLCRFYVDQILSKRKDRVRHFIVSKLKLFLYRRRSKIKIITLVRNPFDRNISHFFQDLQFWLCDYTLKKRDFRKGNKDLIAECFENSFNFDYAKYWFSEEIKRFSNIDILDCDFNVEKGVGRIENGKYDLLIIRMDKMDGLESEISNFVGTNVEIKKSNTGSAKWYNPIYNTFKTSYIPSASVVENTFNTNWVKKCYNKDEIVMMKAKAVKDYN